MTQSTTGGTTTAATDTTTQSATKSCLVTNESRDGAAWVVQPTMYGNKVMLMTQWYRSANVTKLDATLDGDRLFEAHQSVLAGKNVSGFGRPVGTAPLVGQLRVELYDNGTQVGHYEADVVCRQTSSVVG